MMNRVVGFVCLSLLPVLLATTNARAMNNDVGRDVVESESFNANVNSRLGDSGEDPLDSLQCPPIPTPPGTTCTSLIQGRACRWTDSAGQPRGCSSAGVGN
jgi:hypothetical protein